MNYKEQPKAATSKDSRLAQLIDERRKLAAKLAGKELEIAMEVGDRDAAQRHMQEMNAQTTARHAARTAQCFVDVQREAGAQGGSA